MGIFQCRVVQLIWIILGQGRTVLTVGADGAVRLFFLSRLPFLFPPPTTWDEWIYYVILRLFQQNFSYIRTMGKCWMAVCNGIPLTIEKIPASSGARIRNYWISRPAPTPPSYRGSSLCETARYGRKYCLKEPLNPTTT